MNGDPICNVCGCSEYTTKRFVKGCRTCYQKKQDQKRGGSRVFYRPCTCERREEQVCKDCDQYKNESYYTFKFGKYKDRRLSYVLRQDMEYCYTLLENEDFPDKGYIDYAIRCFKLQQVQ